MPSAASSSVSLSSLSAASIKGSNSNWVASRCGNPPLDLDVGHGRCLAVDGGRLFDGDAELVLAEAGGDIGVRACVDVQVDPHRDPRLLAHAACDPVQALQLGFWTPS